MQDKRSSDVAPEDDSLVAQDRHSRRQVLNQVLFLYPESMTLEELTRELTVASEEFSEVDRIRRAVRDLTAGGLLRTVGGLIHPTRAAVNFDALREE